MGVEVMKLCVGAVSRRVVEEAARLQVAQIVASRRQVDVERGYTGWNQKQLVEVVQRLSKGQTKVVRDHGGPNQGWEPDSGVVSLRADCEADFDGLHLDVCKLPRSVQIEELRKLGAEFGRRGRPWIEVGGEHEPWEWNVELFHAYRDVCGTSSPTTIVLDVGTFAWADRQCGSVRTKGRWSVQNQRAWADPYRVDTKAHNCDWLHRTNMHIADYYNLAPELAQVEINALLTVVSHVDAELLLNAGYASHEWQRWFKADEGTRLERAKCGLRYVLESVPLDLSENQETFIREAIADAIQRG
jgi:hypothetical protein